MSFSALRVSKKPSCLRVNTLRLSHATSLTRSIASGSGGNAHASKPNSAGEKDSNIKKTLGGGVTGEHARGAAASATSSDSNYSTFSHTPQDAKQGQSQKPMSMSERDARMKEILDDHSGEGGAAGLELEDGKPVAMKRGGKFCFRRREIPGSSIG